MIVIKRIYEKPEASDGKRILVDRIWPRGMSKERAQLHRWMKEIAPSPDLRKSFCHRAELFETFKQKYNGELEEDNQRQVAANRLLQWSEQGTVTLLYAAKDQKYNHAVVLKEYLEGKKRKK